MLGLIRCLSAGAVLPRNPALRLCPAEGAAGPAVPLSGRAVAEMGTYRKVDLLRRLRRAGDGGVVDRCLADCGAAGFADKRLSDLSGGQKQRVLIARALAAEPEILVLDEPLAGIDITTQQALLKLLKGRKESATSPSSWSATASARRRGCSPTPPGSTRAA